MNDILRILIWIDWASCLIYEITLMIASFTPNLRRSKIAQIPIYPKTTMIIPKTKTILWILCWRQELIDLNDPSPMIEGVIEVVIGTHLI